MPLGTKTTQTDTSWLRCRHKWFLYRI